MSEQRPPEQQPPPGQSPWPEEPPRQAGPELTEPGRATTGAPDALRRSRRDRVIGGVCGGLGRYAGVDPVLFRLAFVLLLLLGGSGFLLYIIAWIIIPEAREGEERDFVPRGDRGTATTIIGGVLVALGALILIQRFTPWFDMRVFGAMILIGIGLFIVARGVRRG
jgi:phage shock protein C